MTKDESKIMQGVAILFMMYLHLFDGLSYSNLYQDIFYLCGYPIAYILARCTNPVTFFLILSGYGLYTVENKNKGYNIINKIKKLYIHYWISLLIFVPVGAYVLGTSSYPGTWKHIVANVTAWDTNSWNGTIWFFFPYILLALSSKLLFKLMNNTNIWLFMGISLFLTFSAMFSISRFGATFFFSNHLLYMPILYFDCLFAFVSGAWLAKFHIVERVKSYILSHNVSSYLIWMLFVLLIAFRCCFTTGAFHTFYAIAFIVLFVSAPRWKYVDRLLLEVGRRSTSMWFVHAYFCYFLFHDFIYSFKYPLIIFLVLFVCSYVSAIVIDWINKKVQILMNFYASK